MIINTTIIKSYTHKTRCGRLNTRHRTKSRPLTLPYNKCNSRAPSQDSLLMITIIRQRTKPKYITQGTKYSNAE